MKAALLFVCVFASIILGALATDGSSKPLTEAEVPATWSEPEYAFVSLKEGEDDDEEDEDEEDQISSSAFCIAGAVDSSLRDRLLIFRTTMTTTKTKPSCKRMSHMMTRARRRTTPF